MKKRILSFMTILILCLGLAVPDFAEETDCLLYTSDAADE